MSAAELDVYTETETERIQRWRAEELARAGYGSDEIDQLAVRHDIDLHLAVGLIERGCPPETALRILLRAPSRGGNGRFPPCAPFP